MLSIFYSDMMARGFEKPRSLSLNIISVVEMFYKVAFSTLKTIPRLALKREIFHHYQMEEKLDAYNVSRALQITFKKILPKEDNDILFPFIFEHFPQVQISKIDMAEKNEGSQTKKIVGNHPFVEQVVTILEREDWPLLIGPVGIGKTSVVNAAAKCLKEKGNDYEVCQVSLSSYSSNEIFGWEKEGKRFSGILSNYLDQTSKAMLIVLQAPLSENVAQVLASMYDNRVTQKTGPKEKHSISHRFVIEACTSEVVSPVLLARCSIISISKEDEEGLCTLFPAAWQRTGKWSSDVEQGFSKLKDATSDLPMLTKDDTEIRRMTRQTLTLFKLMVKDSSDATVMANCVVSSFCWSFGVSCFFTYINISRIIWTAIFLQLFHSLTYRNITFISHF